MRQNAIFNARTNMNKLYFSGFLLLLMATLSAGCQQTPLRENAPTVSQTPLLVPVEEAAEAPDEPVPQTKMAMPCLQFKNRDGLLKWLDAYQGGEEEKALNMAKNIHLPDKPELQFINAVRMSQVDGALQTSLCNIQKSLGVYTWAVEFADTTTVYAYRNPDYKQIAVAMPAITKTEQAYTSTTDLTQLNFPLCLPKTITPSELIWFCGTPYENWKEVHVNRKMGNMKQISCEIKKGDEIVKPGLGCLDPSASQ